MTNAEYLARTWGSATARLGGSMAVAHDLLPGPHYRRFVRAYNAVRAANEELTLIVEAISGEAAPPLPTPWIEPV